MAAHFHVSCGGGGCDNIEFHDHEFHGDGSVTIGFAATNDTALLLPQGQWKNPDFLFKNPDSLLRNPDFLSKNVDFIIKTASGLKSVTVSPVVICTKSDGFFY